MKKGFTFFCLLLFMFFLTNGSAENPIEWMDENESHSISLSDFPSTILNDTLVSIEDTVYIQIGDCALKGQVCIDIAPVDISNFQITNNGFPYSGGLLACDVDTLITYTYSNLFGQGQLGPYLVQSWFVSGNLIMGDFQVIEDLVDSMNVWDPIGDWMLDATNELIIGGSTANTYSDLILWVVQNPSQQLLAPTTIQIPRGTLLNFDVGMNHVKVTDFGTGCVDSFSVHVACIETETVMIDTLFPGAIDTFCLNFFELQAPLDPLNGVTNICAANGNVNFQFANGLSCIEMTTISPGIDSACIVACDTLGFCDTTYIVVNVQDPNPNRIIEYNEIVFENQTGTLCLDTTMLGGPVDTIYSLCESNGSVSFDLDTSSLCLSYTGLSLGELDTFCLVVCDETPICDTNYVYIRVNRDGPAYVSQTLYLNQEGVFCDFDLTNLNGTLTSIQNGCAGSSGNFVDFTVDNVLNCVEFTGIDIGQDTACIYLTDDQGITDTTFLIVNILNPTPSTFFDTIRVDNTVNYCLETLQLGPNVLDTVFLCNDFAGTAVNFEINNVSLCLDVEALTPGNTDSICVYICDELQSCDTTYLVITVREEITTTPPIANPDTLTTPLNASNAIDVCLNDSLFGFPVINFFVLPIGNGGVGPHKGIAFGNAECSITYIPEQDSCGLDSFSYVIRTEMGWDTTTVQVTIDCPPGELTIYNAFSPNGDDVNPFFRIDGVETYPNHQLHVYNRWGNQVLTTDNYQNDWDGTWNGVDLLDGTYYYVFDDGEGNILSGYVYISR